MAESARVFNRSKPGSTPIEVLYCDTFLCRLRGLSFRRTLPPDWGLLLVQSQENRRDASIHMFGMWLDLAVVWISSRNEVVDVRPAYRWRSFLVPKEPALYVLETSISYIGRFEPGDSIEIQKNLSA